MVSDKHSADGYEVPWIKFCDPDATVAPNQVAIMDNGRSRDGRSFAVFLPGDRVMGQGFMITVREGIASMPVPEPGEPCGPKLAQWLVERAAQQRANDLGMDDAERAAFLKSLGIETPGGGGA